MVLNIYGHSVMSHCEARITVGSHGFRVLCNLYKSEKEGKETGRRGQGRGDQVGKEIGWVREGKRKGEGDFTVSPISSELWLWHLCLEDTRLGCVWYRERGTISSGEFVFLEGGCSVETPTALACSEDRERVSLLVVIPEFLPGTLGS